MMTSLILKKLEETTSNEKTHQDIFSESALYTDIELILNRICSAEVKVSVESHV